MRMKAVTRAALAILPNISLHSVLGTSSVSVDVFTLYLSKCAIYKYNEKNIWPETIQLVLVIKKKVSLK